MTLLLTTASHKFAHGIGARLENLLDTGLECGVILGVYQAIRSIQRHRLKLFAGVTQQIDDAAVTVCDACCMAAVNEEDVRAAVDNIFEIGKSLAELAIGIKFSYLFLLASIQDFSIVMSSS